jgi:ABC-type oligopeptide transport system substrate-binding subunit/DNA-binding SARP family transcriptional activator
MPVLRLFLLGPLGIRHDDQPLPKPPTRKSQSLLAYLVLHRQQPQSRERLADLFWGDRPERRARRSLTTALWHIRRCLLPADEDVLLSDVHSVQLNPDIDLWLDVAEFESLIAHTELPSLQSAIALYRGDFMDGFYDDWILNERYRLETLFSEALARLMRGLETGDDHENALAAGLRLLQHNPLREDAYRLTMRVHCRLGQRNAALEQYRRCQQIVQQELDTEPMAETVELYQDILDGRFEIGKPVAAAPVARAEGIPTSTAGYNPLDPIVYCPLTGRESEMAFFLEQYAQARAGRGGLVLIHGEAGVGKTRLVEELADHVRWQGVRVLWGRCYAFERILPYQPVGEALQAILSSMSPGELADIPAWVLAELTHLVPELSEKLPESGDSSTAAAEEEQTHLFESVALFLCSLATHGALLLILDDLHWATESTLQMIHYLARRLAEQPVLIVGTLRPEAVGPTPTLTSFRRQLDREGLVQSWNLGGLSPRATEALVVKMAGGGEAVAPLAHRLYEETEGNPFFLMESIKALFEAGWIELESGVWKGDFAHISEAELPLPAGVSEAVQARVHRLDRETQKTLNLAAVLGREFDFDVLNAAGKQDEEATLEALETLLRRRFVSEGSGVVGRDYAFHHHKIQEVVYVGLSLRRRQLLHARVAEALEGLYASNAEEVAGELAFHFSQTRQENRKLTAKAVRYLLLAGDQARLAYAHREAVDYYNQALALQKEQGEYEQAGRTLMKLGLAYHTSSDFVRAHRAFEEGFAQWQQGGRQDVPIPLPPAPHALRVRWLCPYSLDPARYRDYVSSLVISQMFSGLVTATPDLDVVPEVAQRWEVLDGGRRYRFYLRPDARWSDGAPLTARDFEYAWKRTLDPQICPAGTDLLVIKGAQAFRQGEGDQVGIRVLDDRTLDVELEEPTSHFLDVLTAVRTYPVPQHVVESFSADWTDVDKIVSNGAFRLEAWDRGECMKLARNPLYAGRWRGNVEQVVLYFPQDGSIIDLTALLEQYLRGDLDVLTLMDASAHQGDRIRRQFAAEYLSAPWLFTIYLGVVTSRSPVDDVRLRQALAMGVDQEALANVTLRGMYAPGTGGYVPYGMTGHSPQVGIPYQPDRARELLAAAGYGSDPPTLEGLTVPTARRFIPQHLQAKWQENLGIEVTWEVADWPAFQRRFERNPPHLFILGGFATRPDPGDFLLPTSERLFTQWRNQSYDKLVEQATRTLDPETRLALLRQADQILVHEASIVPLTYGRQHMLVKPWVSSFPISALNRWYWKDTIIEPH